MFICVQEDAQTVLISAAELGYAEIVDILVLSGASISARNRVLCTVVNVCEDIEIIYIWCT
jgi:hypothetical protein